MTTTTVEIEVASQFSAENVFKVFNQFHSIAPKVNPQVIKSIETIEGDGGVGTIRLFTFGDAVPFTSGKYKQDTIDASNFSYNYTFFEGDNLMGILDSINNYVKIVPSADGGCVYKHTIVYNCKGDEKPSAEALSFDKEQYEKTFRAMEAYAVAHQEEF